MECDNECDDLFECFEQQPLIDISKENSGKKRKISESKVPTKIKEMEIIDQNTDQPTTIDIDYPDVTVTELFSGLGCRHEVAVPSKVTFSGLNDTAGEPAKKYPFVLDDFQKRAISCISNNQSVLVSAHTSSGKTVVAEYAIAQCISRQQRVIYTSPIKALSNQKYRELSAEFGDVGLQTGDVTLNPTASCVIMTTEILRSMLYRGSELLREVAWIIFDEIHYMRDRERGVVWEESIVMLPDAVRFVFLSATVPNASQFAQWVAHIHNQVCHVISTDTRPTPLQHYLYKPSERRLYLLLDSDGKFRNDHLKMAVKNDEGKSDARGKSVSELMQLIQFMASRQFSPVIIFSFSKRECEHYAMALSDSRFNDEKEALLVEEVFSNAIASIPEEDQTLPQIPSSLNYLKRGIGIHHSGLLPLLKEVTEILFSEGLVKFLFATETFAMGLNMPARTVVFTSLQKFDGQSNRFLQSGEYIQMSGRAGRRGIDDRGVCILIPDPGTDRNTICQTLTGPPSPLTSAFRLTYNMILNLLRIEGADPEYMMSKSFFQFQLAANLPNITAQILELKDLQKCLSVTESSPILAYARLLKEQETMSKEYTKMTTNPSVIRPFLTPGRLVFVRTSSREFGWGCILNRPSFERKLSVKDTIDVLLNVNIEKDGSYVPCTNGELRLSIIPVSFDAFSKISAVRIYMPESLNTQDSKIGILKSIKKIEKKFKSALPLLDPVKDLRLSDQKSVNFFETWNKLEDRIASHSYTKKLSKKGNKAKKSLEKCQQWLSYSEEISSLETQLRNIKSVVQLNDLRARKRVLRRLGFINASDMVEVKGRVACEISSADELVLTELLFNGFFNDISHRNISAVLSCFLFQEKSNESADLSEENKKLYAELIKTATRVHKISSACNVLQDENKDYLSSFNKDLMEVFSRWTDGSSFKDILEYSSVFEGSIIRCLRRLDELLKELIQASKSIGNAELEKKFRECSRKIKRNIAFSASLYL